MSWNQAKYTEGYEAATTIIELYGLQRASDEYDNIEGPDFVNEYEVGYRTALEERMFKNLRD